MDQFSTVIRGARIHVTPGARLNSATGRYRVIFQLARVINVEPKYQLVDDLDHPESDTLAEALGQAEEIARDWTSEASLPPSPRS